MHTGHRLGSSDSSLSAGTPSYMHVFKSAVSF
jgi:hypothetical protein